MIDPSLPPPLRDAVSREVDVNERIDWIGQPKPIFFTPSAVAAFLFAIPWTAFALFWTAAAGWGTMSSHHGSGPWILFPLFGVPFILIGLAMLMSPLWAHRKARNTVYVITDRRAISIEGSRSRTIRSYMPSHLQDLHRTERSNGYGDVIISRRTWSDSDGDRRSEEIGFLRINDAQDVERKLKALAKKADPAIL